jgi:putative membrane protein
MVFSKRLRFQKASKSKLERLNFLISQQFIIVSKVWWQVLLILIYSVIVISLNFYYSNLFYMGWSASLVPILGVVTGLLLVFRTNTAYDRYYEGRRLWSQMIQVIRVLVRSIWIIVPENSGKDVVEKKAVTNFLVAYAIASKHYLREEYSYDHKDLKDLIHHFPQMFSEPRFDVLKKLRVLNYAPPSNIPLQILYYIAIFVQTIKERQAWGKDYAYKSTVPTLLIKKCFRCCNIQHFLWR